MGMLVASHTWLNGMQLPGQAAAQLHPADSITQAAANPLTWRLSAAQPDFLSFLELIHPATFISVEKQNTVKLNWEAMLACSSRSRSVESCRVICSRACAADKASDSAKASCACFSKACPDRLSTPGCAALASSSMSSTCNLGAYNLGEYNESKGRLPEQGMSI